MTFCECIYRRLRYLYYYYIIWYSRHISKFLCQCILYWLCDDVLLLFFQCSSNTFPSMVLEKSCVVLLHLYYKDRKLSVVNYAMKWSLLFWLTIFFLSVIKCGFYQTPLRASFLEFNDLSVELQVWKRTVVALYERTINPRRLTAIAPLRVCHKINTTLFFYPTFYKYPSMPRTHII